MFSEERAAFPTDGRPGWTDRKDHQEKYSLQQEKTIMGFPVPEVLNPLVPDTEIDYLLGLRGLLVFETFLYFFLQVFAPTTVKDSANTSGPVAHEILRKTLSVLFWNGSLIYSALIFLSARTMIVPFFSDPVKYVAASSIARRPFRLALPVIVAVGISTLIFNSIGREYITAFATKTGNKSIATPTAVPSFLVYFNSVFNIFWATRSFNKQNGSTCYPSQTLWIVSVIFQQSYTLYMTMVIVPYTRPHWRVKAFILFIITAWWVQSWAWYSITGLLLVDFVHTFDLRQRLSQGIPLGLTSSMQMRLPSWIPCILSIFVGFMMQYFWVAWKPSEANGELKAHGGMYNSGRLNAGFDPSEPQARMDNFLVLVGFFFLLECSSILRSCFSIAPLVALGRRSYSIFLISPIIIYTAGIKLFDSLAISGSMPKDPAVFVTLIVCMLTVGASQEIFYRLIEAPSLVAGKVFWDWIRK